MLISTMLVCAVLASLAFGVLVAYGICLAFFRLIGGRAAAPVRIEAARVEVASKV